MSTRAIYSFCDADLPPYHVYKHHDGYPSGAAEWIEKALKHAWELPRFEADEFAAAFVAANKPAPSLTSKISGLSGGGIRLLHSGPWQEIAPGDIEYRYEIYVVNGTLCVNAFQVSQNYKTGKWSETELFKGSLDQFKRLCEELNVA